MTDDIIVPFKARTRHPEPPLTPEERWFHQLMADFGGLPVEGQIEVIFAGCDTDAMAQITARLVEYLNWERCGKAG